ncbi:MAG: acyltransferase [Verrucomicrobiaceae bacterium]|nr:acyltransferase [Verrucomicrobiaceae bacterium]
MSSLSRIPALDSLRFLAATVVVFVHARAMMGWSAGEHGWIERLLDARSAVIFFFVLSGYVLQRSWGTEKPTVRSWVAFVVRRWFRMVPLYYAALLLAVLLFALLPLASCPWFRDGVSGATTLHRDHADLRQWLAHVLLIDPRMDSSFINPPVWTLVVELQMALLFPWLAWLVARARSVWFLGLWAGVTLLSQWLESVGVANASCFSLFIAGMGLAVHGESWVPSLKPQASACIMVGGLMFYTCPELPGAWWRLHATLIAVGSALIMASAMALPVMRRLLEHRLLVHGGEASYGIYVLHFPLLMAVSFELWKNHLPAWLILPLGFGISWLLASALRARIELPMIEVGRRLARKLR